MFLCDIYGVIEGKNYPYGTTQEGAIWMDYLQKPASHLAFAGASSIALHSESFVHFGRHVCTPLYVVQPSLPPRGGEAQLDALLQLGISLSCNFHVLERSNLEHVGGSVQRSTSMSTFPAYPPESEREKLMTVLPVAVPGNLRSANAGCLIIRLSPVTKFLPST